jgi:carbon monoxide dehydrogenase subunit G
MEVTSEKTFPVNADINTVWGLLSDPSRVVVCVPGAQLTEIVDDNNFKGKISVKIGPVTSKFNGEARFDRLDADAKEMALFGAGKDTGGKGSAQMNMDVKLTEKENGTEVHSTIKLSISGKLAQFGARMIVAVNDKLTEQFVGNFQKLAEGGATAEAPAAPEPAATKVEAPDAAVEANDGSPTTVAVSAAEGAGLEARVAALEATVKSLESQVRVLQSQANPAEEPEPMNGLAIVAAALKGLFSGKK